MPLPAQPRAPTSDRRPLLAAGAAVLAVAAALLFHDLGAGSLQGDEAIHAQVSRNAATAPAPLPLRLGGDLYLSKPPLKILAQAAVFRLAGVSTFTARALDAAAGVALVLAVFVLALPLGRTGAAALAALLPLTAHGWVFDHNVRRGTQDAALGALLTLALLLYFRHVEAGRRRPALLVASALVAGMALLVKGPVGLFVPPLLLAYELGLRRLGHPEAPSRPLDALRHTALALVLPLGYLVYLTEVAGRALLRNLRKDLVERAAQGIDPTHVHGPLYYAGTVAGDLGWWLLLLAPALLVAVGRPRRLAGDAPGDAGARARRRLLLFAALWAGIVLGAFSLPASKLPWYVFPAYPALAVLVAGGAVAAAPRLPRPVRWAGAAALALALAAGLAATWRATGIRPPLAPEHRLARAIEATGGFRMVIKRGTPLHAEARFYLQPLGETTWRIPRDFWRAGPCRFVLRRTPWAEEPGGGGPASVALPERRPGRQLWLIDVDHCLGGSPTAGNNRPANPLGKG
jgi:4-amino-4-deoxy-L-arabinose transferase-like glycosyltransferase